MFTYTETVQDLNDTSVNTSYETTTLRAPSNSKVTFIIGMNNFGVNGVIAYIRTGGATTDNQFSEVTGGGNFLFSGFASQGEIDINLSRQINYRASVSTGTFILITMGFVLPFNT